MIDFSIDGTLQSLLSPAAGRCQFTVQPLKLCSCQIDAKALICLIIPRSLNMMYAAPESTWGSFVTTVNYTFNIAVALELLCRTFLFEDA